MSLNRQSAIVSTTLQELMNRNRKEAANVRKSRVLALLFYHMNGMDEGLEALKMLREHGIIVRVCLDASILEHYQINHLAKRMKNDDLLSFDQAAMHKEDFDHFLLPVLPFSVVSDLMRFNDRHIAIRILLFALMSGRNVSALSAGADPYHTIWQDSGLNQGTSYFKHKMKNQLQELRGFGIHLFDDSDQIFHFIHSTYQKQKKKIITSETMMKFAASGQRYIQRTKGTIITPLARDTAKKYQIEISE
ncbi:hypothetical protein [Virgibacillus alimentarius]|uniref:hypothetical protein n=1 Tax=Virgibacillus alimentarius TaxID=698769 RepID=UPI0004937A98|nr:MULTISPECIES: hypothetical protein [Virgibacillus]HLR69682.1 hypothetical protein [Virgibacillus sp.]